MDRNTLAEFRPKVKPGQIESSNDAHFYILESSGKKLKVPKTFLDFFTLAQGQHTIQEIFTRFYERHHHVPFRGFLSFIFDLSRQDILENSKELAQFQKKKNKVESLKNITLILCFLEILVMVAVPAWRTALIAPLALSLSSYFLLETWAFSYFNFFVFFPLVFCLSAKTAVWGLPWFALHCLAWYFKVKSKKTKKNKDAASQKEVLEQMPLFNNLSKVELRNLLSHARTLHLESGAYITKKGEVAQHVYVLLEGDAEIVLANKEKIRLTAPCVFGESALQSESVRQADIKALSFVKILQLDARLFPKVDNPEIRELEIAVKQFFKTSPVFSYFGESVSNSFLMYGRVLYIGAGQTIFEENADGDSLYLLLRGAVDIQMQNKVLKTLKQGDLFGEISLMAHTPRTATVVANTNALLLEIPSLAFWEILTQNLDLALLIESIGAQRFNEAQEFKLNTAS